MPFDKFGWQGIFYTLASDDAIKQTLGELSKRWELVAQNPRQARRMFLISATPLVRSNMFINSSSGRSKPGVGRGIEARRAGRAILRAPTIWPLATGEIDAFMGFGV